MQKLWELESDIPLLEALFTQALQGPLSSVPPRIPQHLSSSSAASSTASVGGSEVWRLFFVKTLLVPPPRFRPSNEVNGIKAENPQTSQLTRVLNSVIQLKQIRDMGGLGMKKKQLKDGDDDDDEEEEDPTLSAEAEKEEREKALTRFISICLELQSHVNGFMDSSKAIKTSAG